MCVWHAELLRSQVDWWLNPIAHHPYILISNTRSHGPKIMSKWDYWICSSKLMMMMRSWSKQWWSFLWPWVQKCVGLFSHKCKFFSINPFFIGNLPWSFLHSHHWDDQGPHGPWPIGFLPEQVIPMSPYVHWLISIFPIENGQCEGNARLIFRHTQIVVVGISLVLSLYVPIQSCGYIQ